MVIAASPVIAINHAVALAEAIGPEAGLTQLERAAVDEHLLDYQPYWAARASLLERAGRTPEACDAYMRAAGLETDPAVRDYLMRRRAQLL